MGNRKQPEFHETVHWRKIRTTLSKIAQIENFDLSLYDTQNIRCYSCVGNDLEGRNVTYCTNDGASCFVGDNTYSVFEVPSLNNNDKSNFCGKHVFLAHDIPYDY
jgi:hypothetical protein